VPAGFADQDENDAGDSIDNEEDANGDDDSLSKNKGEDEENANHNNVDEQLKDNSYSKEMVEMLEHIQFGSGLDHHCGSPICASLSPSLRGSKLAPSKRWYEIVEEEEEPEMARSVPQRDKGSLGKRMSNRDNGHIPRSTTARNSAAMAGYRSGVSSSRCHDRISQQKFWKFRCQARRHLFLMFQLHLRSLWITDGFTGLAEG
jgi:hypothetical protein